MKSDLPGSLYLQLTIHRNKLLQTEKEKIDNRDFLNEQRIWIKLREKECSFKIWQDAQPSSQRKKC